MASLTLRNIHKRFGTTPVLSGMDLDVADGEFMVIVGPSGCGKSTLLRIIAGLEDIEEGTIAIGETDVTHFPPSKRRIAMVFQSYALYPHMTVVRKHELRDENCRSFPRKTSTGRCARLPTHSGLTALLDR